MLCGRCHQTTVLVLFVVLLACWHRLLSPMAPVTVTRRGVRQHVGHVSLQSPSYKQLRHFHHEFSSSLVPTHCRIGRVGMGPETRDPWRVFVQVGVILNGSHARNARPCFLSRFPLSPLNERPLLGTVIFSRNTVYTARSTRNIVLYFAKIDILY